MRLLPLCLLFTSIACSQAVPDKYASETAVLERSDAVIVMQADGTGYTERTFAIVIKTEAALKELGVLNIPFASASEHVDLQYARARRPDGTVAETNVADALEEPTAVTREAPFYSDQKVKQLPIRSLHVGDTLEWKARIVRTKAEAANEFWGEENFTDSLVALEESVELHVPLASPAHVWTNPLQAKPVETSNATERVYRWQHQNLKAMAGKEAEAAAEAKKKHVLTAAEQLDAREGKLPALAWSTYPSWAAVGEWYRKLEQGRTTPDADIKAKVAELTAGKTTLDEKVRAVYAYVSLQIRYIGVAFGAGRYQPHQASEVLSNQYGDCKDKHTLLAAMLTDLGLQPGAVLIGQGIRFNPELPSPGAFNHLITQVAVDGKTLWLDTTEEVAPYDMLMLPLRDEQALVIPETGLPALERTPLDPPFPTVQTMTAVGALDRDGTSNSRITISIRGDQELVMRAVLRQVPPGSYPELIQRLSEGMGYGGTASHPEFGRPEETAVPFSWTYDYKREKGGDWEHYRIIPQVAYRSLPVIDAKEPPTSDIDLGVPRVETSTSAMKLPQGWGAELPEAIHASAPFATLDETFRLAEGTVHAELRLTVLKRYVPVAEWKTYQKFIDQAGLDNQVYIQLTNTGVAGPHPPSTGASAASMEQAAQLIRDAFTAMQKNDFASAKGLLKQAGALNGAQRDLAGAYGALAYDQGGFKIAVQNYQEELAQYPDSFWVYAPLARAQVRLGQQAAAVATLRAWTALQPTNDAAALQLSILELQQTDTPAAERAKAAARLAGLCATSDDPLTLNDAAYYLADANLELPAAEQAERKALDRLDAESQAWTLDETPAVLRAKSSLIVASWDSLGWIYFREGKVEEALAQVQAAWLNHQDAAIGEHLGDIQSRRGRQSEALAAYVLALATMPRRQPDEAQKKRLQDKAVAAREAGGVFDEHETQNTLAHLRIHSLGPASGSHGAAEYKVLLSAGKVEKAQASGDKTVPGGTTLIESLKPGQMFPPGSPAKLVRAAVLNCTASCELIFEP